LLGLSLASPCPCYVGWGRTVIDGATTRFVYDEAHAIAEHDASGAVLRRTVFGPRPDEPLVVYRNGARAWLHADRLGSIAANSNDAGHATEILAYGPWGEPGRPSAGRFGYTGQMRFAELGLYNFKARFYAPSLGRFMQTDPIGTEDGMNLYAYVHNDPLNATDPTGTFFTPETAWDVTNVAFSYSALLDSINARDWFGTTVAAFGTLYDVGATVAPFLPAGAGVGLKAYRAAQGAAIGSNNGLYRVGAYNEIKGTASGLDAHHVGQKALMGEMIPGYDPLTAPAILIPKIGHTIRGPQGIVSRSIEGLTTAREVVARDIMELRRVYPGIPNSQLQELIRMNKIQYPHSFRRQSQ